MQTANAVHSAVKNIRYYVEQIREANNKQFDLDMEASSPGKVDLNAQRVKMSGEIGYSCALILTACQNIERQVQIGESHT